jgi:hypothetical protein
VSEGQSLLKIPLPEPEAAGFRVVKGVRTFIKATRPAVAHAPRRFRYNNFFFFSAIHKSVYGTRLIIICKTVVQLVCKAFVNRNVKQPKL